ncbi:hypothetical protein OU787_27420 [Kitasatospora sp. YST-16]|nr:hypothetical protein [Kitasatospora sp. YST-16]WAL74909.1 hypothetical protein OU787_27420 [Kitasatospora sp. YST-16]
MAGALAEHAVDVAADLADVLVVDGGGLLDALGLGDVVVLPGRVGLHVLLGVLEFAHHLGLGAADGLGGALQRVGDRHAGLEGGSDVRAVAGGELLQVLGEAVGGGAGHAGHRPLGGLGDRPDVGVGHLVPGFPGVGEVGEQVLVPVGEGDVRAVLVALDGLEDFGEVGGQLDHGGRSPERGGRVRSGWPVAWADGGRAAAATGGARRVPVRGGGAARAGAAR